VWHQEAQTTTRGILAVRAGPVEILLQYIRRFRSGPTLTYFKEEINLYVLLFSAYIHVPCAHLSSYSAIP